MKEDEEEEEDEDHQNKEEDKDEDEDERGYESIGDDCQAPCSQIHCFEKRWLRTDRRTNRWIN